MSVLHIPLSTYAHDDRAVGVLLHRDDARLLTLAGGHRGVLQRALRAFLRDDPLHLWWGLFQWVLLAVWLPCTVVLALRLLRVARAAEALR